MAFLIIVFLFILMVCFVGFAVSVLLVQCIASNNGQHYSFKLYNWTFLQVHAWHLFCYVPSYWSESHGRGSSSLEHGIHHSNASSVSYRIDNRPPSDYCFWARYLVCIAVWAAPSAIIRNPFSVTVRSNGYSRRGFVMALSVTVRVRVVPQGLTNTQKVQVRASRAVCQRYG